jgi:uncharacterized membrane protein YeaQ/YmgE (transglycosylase-associated protein family)
MGILIFIVFGFVVGFLARAILPGSQKMGFVMTVGLGIAGSFIGGFIASLISGQPFERFHTSGLIGSLIGAVALLALTAPFLRSRGLAR